MPKNSKATFVLPDSLLEEFREFVRLGIADSLSALVRESLEIRARELRERLLERQFEEAAQDPLFMADLHDAMRAFDGLADEGVDG